MNTKEVTVDTPHAHLWTRDAHLHALTLDRFHLGELNQEEQHLVQAHLDTCALCQSALHQNQKRDAALTLPPMDFLYTKQEQPAPEHAEVITLRPKPARRWPAFAAALGAIAAILLAIWWIPQSSAPHLSDDIRIKGTQSLENNFTWALFAKGPAGPREVHTGDTVHPGERLGFQIHPRVEGHLLILGVDELGAEYLCHPQTQGGTSRPMQATQELVSLEEAVRLDGVLGKERLVALYCDHPVSVDEVRETLLQSANTDLPLERLRRDCAQREILLYKQEGTHTAPRKADGTR